jgi:hypothetical protein
MNTRSLFVLAAALCASAVVAAPTPKDMVAIGYPASKVTVPVWDALLARTASFDIVAGTSRENVQMRLGGPKQMLSPDVWLYDNCQPDLGKAREQSCDLLIITFDGKSVTEMKFVNRPLATLIAADLKRGPANGYALSK